MGPNREYKSSVFSLLFGEENTLRELYEVLEGVALPADLPITINTLEDALFKTKINDISFELGEKLVVILEHQSTINPNMPLRLLSYIARVYEKITAGKRTRLYGKKGFSIPRPEFIVLYNGLDPFPDEETIRLSDSYEDLSSLGLSDDAPADMELTARVYNINEGHNEDMVQKNERLRGYVVFIAKVREIETEESRGKGAGDFSKDERKRIMKRAITKAVQWCIANNVLKGFFEENSSEVINMLFDEWKLEDALVVEREEGREEGREERDAEIAENALREGLPVEFIQKITGLSTETIQNLASR
jgi:predicted transposase/invertase (TIGR01784 family)